MGENIIVYKKLTQFRFTLVDYDKISLDVPDQIADLPDETMDILVPMRPGLEDIFFKWIMCILWAHVYTMGTFYTRTHRLPQDARIARNTVSMFFLYNKQYT